MTKESSVLKIIKGDILRILGERKGKVLLDIIKEEIKASYSYISEAIEELEKEDLIQSQQGFLQLTEKGKEKAEEILRKHLVVENYFKRTKNEEEAHEVAHVLEHYISEEVIKNIKELSTFKGKGILLTASGVYRELLIVDITIPDKKLFERMASMGIFLGEKIKIINKIPNGIIVEIKNKKFALDKDIAKEIEVLEYEKR